MSSKPEKGVEIMLFLVVAGLLAVLSVFCFARYHAIKVKKPNNDWDGGGVFFSFVAAVIVLVGFIVSGAGWSFQVNDFEDVKKFKKVEAIYRVKAEALTTEFARHLATAYPEHEKDIYNKISPDKVGWYFAKYPELRASETLVTLVGHINKLQSDVYNQQIAVEEALKETRFRLRNPWLFTFMIPSE
ncbi:MAG: hypothetical protein Q8R36_02900 [bacterium]|nr:hypothetical protein [bacterium]